MKKFLLATALAAGIAIAAGPVAAAAPQDSPYPDFPDPVPVSAEFRNFYDPAAWTGQYEVIVSPWGTTNLYHIPGYGHAPPSWTQVDPTGAYRYVFPVYTLPDGQHRLFVTDFIR